MESTLFLPFSICIASSCNTASSYWDTIGGFATACTALHAAADWRQLQSITSRLVGAVASLSHSRGGVLIVGISAKRKLRKKLNEGLEKQENVVQMRRSPDKITGLEISV